MLLSADMRLVNGAIVIVYSCARQERQAGEHNGSHCQNLPIWPMAALPPQKVSWCQPWVMLEPTLLCGAEWWQRLRLFVVYRWAHRWRSVQHFAKQAEKEASSCVVGSRIHQIWGQGKLQHWSQTHLLQSGMPNPYTHLVQIPQCLSNLVPSCPNLYLGLLPPCQTRLSSPFGDLCYAHPLLTALCTCFLSKGCVAQVSQPVTFCDKYQPITRDRLCSYRMAWTMN